MIQLQQHCIIWCTSRCPWWIRLLKPVTRHVKPVYGHA